MNITQVNGGRQIDRLSGPSKFVVGAIALLILVAILALAATWALGMWPLNVGQASIERGIDASAARYSALGELYVSRGAEADAARWAALGESHAAAARGRDADSARWAGLGRADLAARGAAADAARWAARGQSYMSSSAVPGSAARPYTDVSMFYAERMRSIARENALFTANPEVMAARRAYVALNELAASPELMAARRAYPVQNELAANPELMSARRTYAVQNELAANPELRSARGVYGGPDTVFGVPEPAIAGASSSGSAVCSSEPYESPVFEGELVFPGERSC